jgi:hypothetical protein
MQLTHCSGSTHAWEQISMWDRVVPMDTRLLERALAVFNNSGREFASLEDLRIWMERRSAQLFHYRSTYFEIAIAFVPAAIDSAWRIAAIGWRGPFEQDHLREAISIAADIVRRSRVTTVEASVLRTAPSDPLATVFESALDIARSLPGVVVQTSDQGTRRHYDITVSPVASIPATASRAFSR